ncbi:uncharacterized protein LOC142232936 [Haematobia irritans]|uniref:uncharacterized protein LOC142232936 n=1 Tax=Haematobia irritans TaxID=7368 RepID=UPI003F4F9973
MKLGNIPCVNDEQTQIGIKLCDGVKRHPCLYDPSEPGYQIRNTVTTAWKAIAKECSDTVANCKFRWKTINKAFTRAYRRYGSNCQYYLQDHLDFLIPHLGVADKIDDSFVQPDENNESQLDEKEDDAILPDEQQWNDKESTTSAEESYGHNKGLLTPIRRNSDPSRRLDKDLTKTQASQAIEKSPLPALPEIQPHLRANDVTTPTEAMDGRPSRTRKPPKRIYELDDDLSEPQREKKQKRFLTRRKSVGGLVLREYIQKNRIDLEDEPQKNMASKEDFSFQMPQPMQTSLEAPEIKTAPNDVKDLEPIVPEPRLPTIVVRSFAKAPTRMDMATNTDSSVNETAEIGIQCTTDEAAVEQMDDNFLESLKPQFKNMNIRQKINFKQRVYLALMDVLDDSKNFPNEENHVVEVPAPLAQHFESTTSGEIRLMRQLVSLVQAAKTSAEIVNATNKVDVVRNLDSSTPQQNGTSLLSPILIDGDDSNSSSSGGLSNSINRVTTSKSTDSLGIPRHILQKAVQVAGGGGTLMAHTADKKRVFRIYPKNPTGPSIVTNGHEKTPLQNSTAGTFFVTPSKPPAVVTTPIIRNPISEVSIRKPSPPAPSPTPIVPIIRGTAIQYPKIIKTTNTNSNSNSTTPTSSSTSLSSTSMLPPTTFSKLPNGTSSNTASPKINIHTHVPSANIFRRRYSICGPALSSSGGGASSFVTPNRSTYTNSKPFTPPPPVGQKIQLQKMSQQPTVQQKMFIQNQAKLRQQHARLQQLAAQTSQQIQNPRNFNESRSNSNSPPPPVQQIHISKPISLNTAAAADGTRTGDANADGIINTSKLFVALDSPRASPVPSSSSLNNETLDGIQQGALDPLASLDVPVLETAGTIAADSFDSEFSKPTVIKTEPDE